MRGCQGVGVATDDFPLPVVEPECGCDAEIKRRRFVARADLRLPMLVFEQRNEARTGVARDLLEPDGLAVAEVGRGEVECLRDRRPSARATPKWIRQQYILTSRIQRFDRRRITNRKCVTCRVVLLNDRGYVQRALPSHAYRTALEP